MLHLLVFTVSVSWWVLISPNITRNIVWENTQHLATLPLVSPQNDVWEAFTEVPHWWRVATQIWVVHLIGWNRFQQIRTTTQIWVRTRHQYGISSLVSHQTSFLVETRGGVAKCRLFSQASRNTEHSANKVESDNILLIFLQLLLKDTGSHGVIASLLSWVTSSNNAPPVLWEIKVSESYKVLWIKVLNMRSWLAIRMPRVPSLLQPLAGLVLGSPKVKSCSFYVIYLF